MKGKDTEANIKKKQKQTDILVTEDPRFKHVSKDPRFERPKKKDVKITLDNRFAQLLKTKEFSESPKVDKYGRPISSDKTETELKRFYRLNSPSTDSLEEKADEQEPSPIGEESSKSSGSDNDNDSVVFDPARGKGVISSSDEDDEDDEETRLEEFEEEGSDEQIRFGEKTHRFAVINLDWDNVKASDLMKLFSSFKIEGSIIKSVKIYPSQFGKERLEKEIIEGPPKEVFKSNDLSSRDDDVFPDDQEVISSESIKKSNADDDFDEELLRKYQLERLKYYHFVLLA
ncbi:4623_t:CDS:2 [Acaulospora colombiana]|uniref:4623_t:CDS:1 n=1 Tax=Acaulospora colombiana TaxID=27376 RepID=A0ACA9M2Z7_9GLOM|nr:4623_t:CDS:2 [Acaulospora colombiana]